MTAQAGSATLAAHASISRVMIRRLSLSRLSLSRPLPYADRVATLRDTPIVIRGTRSRALLVMVVCIAFGVLGLFAMVRGSRDDVAIGLPTLMLFAVGAAIAGILAARPPVLTLTGEGIEMATLLRRRTIAWVDVQDFVIHRVRVAGPTAVWMTADMAAYTRRDAPPPSRFTWLRRPHDIDGGFGPGWPLTARQLVTLLNAARAQALGHEAVSR